MKIGCVYVGWFMYQSCSVLAVQPVNVFQCAYVVDWGEPEHIPHSQSVSKCIAFTKKLFIKQISGMCVVHSQKCI